MPALATVAVLFLIVFSAAAYAITHLKSTPVRIAAVLLALGALVTAMTPVVRILAEPQPTTPPAPPLTAARSATGHDEQVI